MSDKPRGWPYAMDSGSAPEGDVDTSTWSAAEADPWAWMEQPDEAESPVDISGCRVTAVLVTLDAERWLPDTLAGIASLRPRPTRVIAIDNDSTDATPTLLRRARDLRVLDAVYQGRRGDGFGAAVRSALDADQTAAAAAATRRKPGQTSSRQTSSWLWLLHDDAVPAPDALRQLLAHVTLNPDIDITGPKLLLPRGRRSAARLSEVGVSISGTGRREVLVDVGEIDQGQRDEPQRRLGVSTCGMLVRRSVWQELDGLDASLPIFRDGVDFGWRAQLAGYQVITTPSAELTHRQVSRAGLRPAGAAGPHPGAVDRRLGMLVVAGHAPAPLLPLIWLRLVWSCLLHAVGYLFGKVPSRSLDELRALGWFIANPGQIHRVRRRLSALHHAPGAARDVRRLRPPWWSSLRVGAETISAAVADRYRSVAGDSEASSLDELTGDDFAVVSDEKPANPWLSPIVIAGVASVLASLVAARNLFGIGSLVGPALLPAQSSLGELWGTVWAPVIGAPGQSTPPWLALVAVGSTLMAGRPEWFITALLCAVVPLALFSAYPVVRRVIADRRVRLWVATTYALLPVLLGSENQGRLSLSVFAVALPLLVLAARALVLRRARTAEAWRGGWGAGLVLVALVAFEPSMILLVLVLGLAGALALRHSPRKAGRIGIAVAVPLLVWAPWWPSVITSWGRLFTGPDSALGGAPEAPSVWLLLLGRDVGPGLPALWLGGIIFGTIWVVALVGIARRPRRGAVLAAWVTGLLGLTMAVLLSRLVVRVPPVGTEVRPTVGVYLLIGFGALVLAGGAGLDGLSRDLAERSFSYLQPAVVLAGALVGLVTLAAAGWWVSAGASGPMDRQRLDALPPYVLSALQSDARVRVLAVDLSGARARFAVVADDQARLGDADRGYTFGGSTSAPAQAADLVLRMVAGTADSDIGPQLSELGVGFLWVTGASDEEKSRIDNTPGLGTASGNARGTIWQVQPPVSRVTVVQGEPAAGAPGTPPPVGTPVGRSPAVVPPGPGSGGRLLRLGEAADTRWRASLDGRRLTPVIDGWQQAFELGEAGGTVTYGLPSVTHWFLFLQGLVLIVVAVLAAPAIRRPEVRDPAKTARRAATLGTVTR